MATTVAMSPNAATTVEVPEEHRQSLRTRHAGTRSPTTRGPSFHPTMG